MDINQLARIVHEVNRAYCRATGDISQPPWEAVPGWQRKSAVEGIRFVIDNPDAGSKAQHTQWCVDKRKAGWVWDKVKNVELKTHPCLVDYAKLPLKQRAKDAIFIAIVKEVTALCHLTKEDELITR